MFLHFRSRKALVFLVLTTLASASDLAAAPIVPISAVSRKDHGGFVFDVPLPLTGAAGIECRGDTGEHQLAIEFATPVTVTTLAVTTGEGYLSDWWVDGSTVHVFLQGVSDGQRLTVTLSMVRDGTGSVHDVIVPMIVLAGDTTASGNVDGNDSGEVENQIGQPVTVANFRTDVTVDRAIDETDVKFVDKRVGGNSVSLAFPQPDVLASGYGSASVLLRSDGTLSSWGVIPGDGTPRPRSYPSLLPGLTNIISVSAGESHAAALAANSVVWAWGENSEGQVGDDTNTPRKSPVPVMGNATSVKAGGYHTLALLPDGTVAAWGQNSYGQLGFGDTTSRTVPVVINGLTGITQIAAGFQRSLALQTGGTVWTWGYQSEDPNNPGIVFYTEPVQVEGLTQVVAIAAGSGHAVAVVKDGTVHTWGNNASGELGDGTTTYSAVPVEIRGLSKVVAVSASFNHTLALLADGTVQAWGSNEFGQLGIGSDGDFSTVPVQVSSLTNIVAIVAARTYSMALQSDGTIWAWGAPNPALGLASTTNTTSPQQVASGLLDQNANAMDDRWELQYFGNLNQTAEGDYDGDGISNLAEFQNSHTNPASWDSDTDFVSDSEEIAAGSDPNDPASYPPRLRDVSRGLILTSYKVFGHLQYSLSVPWAQLGEEVEDRFPCPLIAELAGLLASRVTFPTEMQPCPGTAMVAASSYAASIAWVQQRRLWLHRYPATNVEARMKVLFVMSHIIGEEWQPLQTRVETLVIPPGQTTSNPADSTNDLTQSQESSTHWVLESAVETMVPTSIEEVSFGGCNYWELKSDDEQITYEAPQWEDVDHNSDPTNTAIGERNNAVAFTRHTKPKIGATFRLLGVSQLQVPIKVRAHGSDGIEIPSTNATINGDYVTLPPTTESSTPFGETVKYYNKNDSTAFTLTWEISLDNEQTWVELGVTKHTVYLTLADPDPEMPLRQETIAYIGSHNANGVESESEAVAKIWREFEGLLVRRVGITTPMTYWGSWASDDHCLNETPSCKSAEGLLKKGDGRCGAWMRFLDVVFRFQGITGSERLRITTKNTVLDGVPVMGLGFLVKNWDVSVYPPQDLFGAPAQGKKNDDPESEFVDHALLGYGGQIYDPSYGHRYSGLSQWEDGSLDFLWYRDSFGFDHGALNSLGDEQTEKTIE